MLKVDDRYILLFYLALIAVVIIYRVNLFGIGDAIAHVWPPLIVVLAILALLTFVYLAVKTIFYFRS